MKNKQRGISLIGALFYASITLFFTIVGIRLLPVYLEHYSVVSSLESLKESNDYMDSIVASTASQKIKKSLVRRLNINGVSRVKPADITTKVKRDGIDVRVTYTATVALIGNVDASIHFDNQILVPVSGN